MWRASRVLVRCQQRKGRERGIARPHQVVAAERIRAVTPGHAEAGDDGAGIGTILVNLQHRRREQSRIARGVVRAAATAAARPSPARPAGTPRAECRRPSASAVRTSVRAPRADSAKPSASTPLRSLGLAAQGHGAVAGARVAVGQRAVVIQILPAVRGADIAAAQMQRAQGSAAKHIATYLALA